jgi:hypothetical protein
MAENQLAQTGKWIPAANKLATEVSHYRIVKPNFHHIANAIKGKFDTITDDNLDEVIEFLTNRVTSEPAIEPVTVTSALPEAPASWNLTYYARGRREQITFRGHDDEALMARVARWRDWVDKHADEPFVPNGHGNGTQPQQSAQTKELQYDPIEETPYDSEPTAPAGDGWERGMGHCVKMSLATSYSGGKPQLQFECDNLQHPLRYTKSIDDMKTLLKTAGVSKPLIAGQKWKIGGEWNVEWAKPPDSKYRNVLSVSRVAVPA